MSKTVTGDVGKLTFEDGTIELMDETHINRVVYALTTLALHKAISHVKITNVENAKGQTIWWHPGCH